MLPHFHFLNLSSPRKALLQQVKQNEQKQATRGNVVTTFYIHLNSLIFSNLCFLLLLPPIKTIYGTWTEYLTKELTWWYASQICYDLMYVKIDGELKSIKRIELKSDSTTILIHTITEEGLEEEYKCTSDSPNYYHLRCLLSSDIYIFSDIVCGNKEHII